MQVNFNDLVKHVTRVMILGYLLEKPTKKSQSLIPNQFNIKQLKWKKKQLFILITIKKNHY